MSPQHAAKLQIHPGPQVNTASYTLCATCTMAACIRDDRQQCPHAPDGTYNEIQTCQAAQPVPECRPTMKIGKSTCVLLSAPQHCVLHVSEMLAGTWITHNQRAHHSSHAAHLCGG